MARQLPLEGNKPFLVYAGTGTDLIFNHGVDLPGFASFPLLEEPGTRAILAGQMEALVDLAPERQVFVAREMTKRFETCLVGSPADLIARMDAAEQWRGEVVCILAGTSDQSAGTAEQQRVMRILAAELPPAQAARIGAQILGVKKKDLYSMASERNQAGDQDG